MGYFRELPELDYQSFLSDSNSSSNYLRVKNLFRRCKLRDDLQNVFTIFNKYEIVEGARPDTVAEELYGDAELHWIVLMTNNVTDRYYQWPLTQPQFQEHLTDKYGVGNEDATHHFEKTTDSGRTTSNGPNDYSHLVECNEDDEGFAIITNRQYEQRKQDEYRSIKLLDTQYLSTFIEEFENLIKG